MPDEQNIILASNSNARRAMLANAGVQFETDPADVDEAELKRLAVANRAAPQQIAIQLAVAKARTVSARHPGAIVIGSDQILEFNGELLSKVQNMSAAAKQLNRLQGQPHQLHSAVACCINGKVQFELVDSATLTMWPLTLEEISAYLDETGTSILGSVGCYQIEGKGVRLFKAISGSHFTIMGMPLIPLLGYLRSFSVPAGEQQQ